MSKLRSLTPSLLDLPSTPSKIAVEDGSEVEDQENLVAAHHLAINKRLGKQAQELTQVF